MQQSLHFFFAPKLAIKGSLSTNKATIQRKYPTQFFSKSDHQVHSCPKSTDSSDSYQSQEREKSEFTHNFSPVQSSPVYCGNSKIVKRPEDLLIFPKDDAATATDQLKEEAIVNVGGLAKRGRESNCLRIDPRFVLCFLLTDLQPT